VGFEAQQFDTKAHIQLLKSTSSYLLTVGPWFPHV
jgi:hypothetical protein